MSPALRLAANAAFALVFAGGAALVWTGIEAFIFGGAGAARAIALLTVGFATWAGLAAIACAPRRGSRP